MAELMGRDGGLCRGLGGSMHLVDVEHGFLGATGVVGGNVPLALGSALARAAAAAATQVAVVFFGDGAVQGGIFVESVNLATLWALPVILVCENNGFAEFTPRSAHTNVERVSDVVAPVRPRARDGRRQRRRRGARGVRAVPRAAREGDGPMLLECLTHRLRGHYEGDPQRYRQALGRRGVAGARPDPAPAAARRRRGLARRGRAARLEQEARDEVEEAVASRARARSRRRTLTAELVYAP